MCFLNGRCRSNSREFTVCILDVESSEMWLSEWPLVINVQNTNKKHRLDRIKRYMYVMRCGEGGIGSYLVNLLRDDNGVVATDLLRAELPIVKRTLVLVAVSMHCAE